MEKLAGALDKVVIEAIRLLMAWSRGYLIPIPMYPSILVHIFRGSSLIPEIIR